MAHLEKSDDLRLRKRPRTINKIESQSEAVITFPTEAAVALTSITTKNSQWNSFVSWLGPGKAWDIRFQINDEVFFNWGSHLVDTGVKKVEDYMSTVRMRLGYLRRLADSPLELRLLDEAYGRVKLLRGKYVPRKARPLPAFSLNKLCPQSKTIAVFWLCHGYRSSSLMELDPGLLQPSKEQVEKNEWMKLCSREKAVTLTDDTLVRYVKAKRISRMDRRSRFSQAEIVDLLGEILASSNVSVTAHSFRRTLALYLRTVIYRRTKKAKVEAKHLRIVNMILGWNEDSSEFLNYTMDYKQYVNFDFYDLPEYADALFPGVQRGYDIARGL